MHLPEKIKTLSEKYFEDTVGVRRHIHANPELSYKEFETAKYVAQKLREFGLEPAEGIAGTGVTALIKGNSPESKTTALRADLDALPIKEANNVPYKSKNEGVMHACGHDVHTSSLLGAARILNELKDEFEGTIKLIFQPGEEKAPGGASIMIKEGVLKNPAPKSILGQHVMPFIPAGKVGFREGMYMASADELCVTVRGKGGHGAHPHLNIDPISISAQIITALQQLVSRNADPRVPTVLSFGKIIAEGAHNVIPDEVMMYGTFRTFEEEWRDLAHTKMKQIAVGIAESMGAKCDFDILRGYPHLKNDPELTKRTRKNAEEYLGKENVEDLDLWPAAEDFAYYTHHIPGCFYRLGTGNEAKGIISSVHTPTFDIDEEALKIGTGLMAYLAINELK